MPDNEKLNFLIKFNGWRTGELEETLDELGLTPRKITEVLDWAIETLKVVNNDK